MEGEYNPLQLREVFHLEFLRWLSKKIKLSFYALKGGVNLRCFYNSPRYSEDIDLNVRTIGINGLQEKVMQILASPSFNNNLKPFGIDEIVPPDLRRAKQTQTTQRFKVHLITPAGEDFFTKIDFSRRKFENNIKIETISSAILRKYKLAPVLVPHYGIAVTILQKLKALADRKITQPRDAFDIYILLTQFKPDNKQKIKLDSKKLDRACKNIFEISFEEFKDTVLSYLSEEDQRIYNSPDSWDEIKLNITKFIEELKQ